jgi:hypothetical protein
MTPHLQENGVVVLQYVNDTIFPLNEGFEYARNLKFMLCLFEQMSGLKINFLKSEVFCFGKCKDMREGYEEVFTCKSLTLP